MAATGTEQIKDSVRLFVVPGVDHCGGGEGTFMIDALGSIDTWVESGKAPEQLVASRPLAGGGRRTRLDVQWINPLKRGLLHET